MGIISTAVKIQFPDGDKRVIGYISTDGETFTKEVDKEHFCRKHQGFGINYEVFKNRLRDGVKDIKVKYKRGDGRKEVYIASVQTWVKNGIMDKLGDFPKQIFLAKSEFDKVLGK